jgi:phage/plasmid-like protein (TIGR03299 family)
MAHHLDMAADGRVAFASARLDAWHRLGTVMDGPMTAFEALSTAHLTGWNVRKQPLQTEPTLTEYGVTHSIPVPGQFATMRTSPFTRDSEVLGVVGNRYTPIQNEEHVDLLDTLVDQSGAHFETAGALRGGREVFVSMKLPEHMSIAGTDDIDLYITALNSHDGTSPFRLLVTPVRVVCANTQAAAIRQARHSFNIRHTASAKGQISVAREALHLAFKYHEAFEVEAEKMIQETITDAAFYNIVRTLFPEPDADAQSATRDRWVQRMRMLDHLFADAATNANIRGTRWAAYQSVTEYIDHYAHVSRIPVGMTDKSARAMRAINAKSTDLKEQAFNLLAV